MTVDETLDEFRHAARRKDFGSALAVWRRLAGKVSTTSDDALLAGQAARAGGDHELAETLLNSVTGEARDEPAFVLEHAALATDRRDWTEAVRRWRRALGSVPETGGIWFNLGWALQWSGELEEADTVLARARSKFPNDERIAVALARNAALRGDAARALDLWDAAAASFPARPHIHLHRVSALREQSEFARAEAAYREAVASCAPTAALLSEGAGLAQAANDLPAAAARWRAVLALDPAHKTAGARLIAALREAGDTASADAAFEAAAAANTPQWPEWLAWARGAEPAEGGTGSWAEAARRWRIAAAAMPDRVEPVHGLIAALRRIGDAEAIAAAVHDGAARFPSDAALMGEYARSAAAAGDHAAAVERFRAIEPMDDTVRAGLLGSLLALDRLDEAQEVWREISPVTETRETTVFAARLATRRHDWMEAERRWDLAAALFPADADEERRGFRRLAGLEWVEGAADPIDVPRLMRQLA